MCIYIHIYTHIIYTYCVYIYIYIYTQHGQTQCFASSVVSSILNKHKRCCPHFNVETKQKSAQPLVSSLRDGASALGIGIGKLQLDKSFQNFKGGVSWRKTKVVLVKVVSWIIYDFHVQIYICIMKLMVGVYKCQIM